jgi:hypothetical protein
MHCPVSLFSSHCSSTQWPSGSGLQASRQIWSLGRADLAHDRHHGKPGQIRMNTCGSAIHRPLKGETMWTFTLSLLEDEHGGWVFFFFFKKYIWPITCAQTSIPSCSTVSLWKQAIAWSLLFPAILTQPLGPPQSAVLTPMTACWRNVSHSPGALPQRLFFEGSVKSLYSAARLSGLKSVLSCLLAMWPSAGSFAPQCLRFCSCNIEGNYGDKNSLGIGCLKWVGIDVYAQSCACYAISTT